jgi:hypothetical protein
MLQLYFRETFPEEVDLNLSPTFHKFEVFTPVEKFEVAVKLTIFFIFLERDFRKIRVIH